MSTAKYLLLSIAVLFAVPFATVTAMSQPGSGDYTTALPSVQQIESEIKGSDPTDTLARQIAVLRRLQTYVFNIAYARSVKAPPTPGEQRAIAAYKLAETQLTEGYAKAHTPDEVVVFNRLCARYVFNQDLYNDYHRLIGKQAVDANQAAEMKEHQSAARMQEQMRAAGRRPSSRDSSSMFGGASSVMENDPQIRRCLELGGTVSQCMGNGLTAIGKLAEVAAGKWVGVDVNAGKPMNGVILVGLYRSRTELPGLELTSDGKAVLRKCGTLVDHTAAYTIRKSGATTQIGVANEPAPIVLTLRPDGSLSGPGSISVKGSVVAGYRNQSNCPVGTAFMNCRTSTMPVYAPSMQRCTIGQLSLQPPPRPSPRPAGLAGVLTDLISQGTPTEVTYGLRLVGTYASSTGMKLEFANRFVTLDCGKAHVNAFYVVDNTPNGFVIRVQNAGGGFQLAVARDNTLRGTGVTTVNGRLVSSFHDEDVSFTPHSETCGIGTFIPNRAPVR